MILLAVTSTGWIVTALNRDRPAAPVSSSGSQSPDGRPAAEMVEILVATKDLPVGTVIPGAEFPNLAVRKPVPRDGLPPDFVTDEADLVEKRLKRPVLKGEAFSRVALVRSPRLVPLGDLDIMSLRVSSEGAGFVGPGSRVDIIASVRRGERAEAFPLLEDVLVAAVDTMFDSRQVGQLSHTVSFAVDQERALLLTLAKQRGCRLELLLRAPGKPTKMTGEEYKKRRMFLEELAENKPEVAPAPRPKRAAVYLPDGLDLVSLPFPAGSPPAAGFVAPGSRVDILVVRPENQSDAFQLLDGVLVISLDSHLMYPPDRTRILSFAVDEQHALLLALAKRAGCTTEVQFRSPDNPPTTTGDDYKKRAKFFQAWLDAGKVPVAPAPRAKGE
jgi:Flp pilus assembly protein CpaB